jgi:hypothetical protein
MNEEVNYRESFISIAEYLLKLSSECNCNLLHISLPDFLSFPSFFTAAYPSLHVGNGC